MKICFPREVFCGPIFQQWLLCIIVMWHFSEDSRALEGPRTSSRRAVHSTICWFRLGCTHFCLQWPLRSSRYFRRPVSDVDRPCTRDYIHFGPSRLTVDQDNLLMSLTYGQIWCNAVFPSLLLVLRSLSTVELARKPSSRCTMVW